MKLLTSLIAIIHLKKVCLLLSVTQSFEYIFNSYWSMWFNSLVTCNFTVLWPAGPVLNTIIRISCNYSPEERHSLCSCVLVVRCLTLCYCWQENLVRWKRWSPSRLVTGAKEPLAKVQCLAETIDCISLSSPPTLSRSDKFLQVIYCHIGHVTSRCSSQLRKILSNLRYITMI